MKERSSLEQIVGGLPHYNTMVSFPFSTTKVQNQLNNYMVPPEIVQGQQGTKSTQKGSVNISGGDDHQIWRNDQSKDIKDQIMQNQRNISQCGAGEISENRPDLSESHNTPIRAPNIAIEKFKTRNKAQMWYQSQQNSITPTNPTNVFYGTQPQNVYEWGLMQSSRFSMGAGMAKSVRSSQMDGASSTCKGDNTKRTLMSETPFSQNQRIMSSLLRANEYKQITQLSNIKTQNEKILQRLQDISKGKDLAVGRHQVQPETTMPKTLHMPKNKRDAKKIDQENNKILSAILNVKPSKCSCYDPAYMTQQQRYMQNITKSQRQSMHDMIRRRVEFIDQQQSLLLPSILHTNHSIQRDGDSKTGDPLATDSMDIALMPSIDGSKASIDPIHVSKSYNLEKRKGFNRSPPIGKSSNKAEGHLNSQQHAISQNSHQKTKASMNYQRSDEVNQSHDLAQQYQSAHLADAGIEALKVQYNQIKNKSGCKDQLNSMSGDTFVDDRQRQATGPGQQPSPAQPGQKSIIKMKPGGMTPFDSKKTKPAMVIANEQYQQKHTDFQNNKEFQKVSFAQSSNASKSRSRERAPPQNDPVKIEPSAKEKPQKVAQHNFGDRETSIERIEARIETGQEKLAPVEDVIKSSISSEKPSLKSSLTQQKTPSQKTPSQKTPSKVSSQKAPSSKSPIAVKSNLERSSNSKSKSGHGYSIVDSTENQVKTNQKTSTYTVESAKSSKQASVVTESRSVSKAVQPEQASQESLASGKSKPNELHTPKSNPGRQGEKSDQFLMVTQSPQAHVARSMQNVGAQDEIADTRHVPASSTVQQVQDTSEISYTQTFPQKDESKGPEHEEDEVVVALNTEALQSSAQYASVKQPSGYDEYALTSNVDVLNQSHVVIKDRDSRDDDRQATLMTIQATDSMRIEKPEKAHGGKVIVLQSQEADASVTNEFSVAGSQRGEPRSIVKEPLGVEDEVQHQAATGSGTAVLPFMGTPVMAQERVIEERGETGEGYRASSDKPGESKEATGPEPKEIQPSTEKGTIEQPEGGRNEIQDKSSITVNREKDSIEESIDDYENDDFDV